MRLLLESNQALRQKLGGLRGELTAIKAEFAPLKAVQPRPIRAYNRRAPDLRPKEAGAGVEAQQRQLPRNRVKVPRRPAATGSGAAGESVPQSPRQSTISTIGCEAIRATLQNLYTEMGQLKGMRQGELEQVKAMGLPTTTNVEAREEDLHKASDSEVFIVLYIFGHHIRE